MKILQTNSYSQQQMNLRATYPVVHNVLTKNGTYITESNINVVKKLQGKLVRTLNTNMQKIMDSLDSKAQQNVQDWIQYIYLGSVKTRPQLPKTEKEALAIFRGIFGFRDLDYAYAPIQKSSNNKKTKASSDLETRVRSFYNREKSLIDGKYYLAYLISGKDIKTFEDNLAKNIGKTKHDGLTMFKNAHTQQSKDAIDFYNKNGLEFVNDPQHRLTSKKDGMTYVLRANFQPILNKFGKVKDYRFISAKFVPEYTK